MKPFAALLGRCGAAFAAAALLASPSLAASPTPGAVPKAPPRIVAEGSFEIALSAESIQRFRDKIAAEAAAAAAKAKASG